MEDEKIINLYWNRTEQAITETSMKYGAYLRTIAHNILSNREDAKECENDTYMAAWNQIPPTKPQRLLAFLGKITRNIALDRYDYNKAKKRSGEFDLLLKELESCLPLSNDVEKLYEDRQIPIIINQYLESADYDKRMMFVRRYWYTDSISTIAKRYGYSESKVKSMLFRMRNELRNVLEEEGVAL